MAKKSTFEFFNRIDWDETFRFRRSPAGRCPFLPDDKRKLEIRILPILDSLMTDAALARHFELLTKALGLCFYKSYVVWSKRRIPLR